jgi:murein tripeptide amidase MpaA
MRIPTILAATLLASSTLVPLAEAPDWRTPAEISEYRTTPDYAETVAYLDRIAAGTPGQVRIENFGKAGEGRDLKIVIASKDGVFDPAAIHASGRAILLVQNSIHAGEMDGKDACLGLLRDLAVTKTQSALLDHVVFIFIPVYNIDGHEQRSLYNRINQNGPELSGSRLHESRRARDTRLPQDVSPLAARLPPGRLRNRRLCRPLLPAIAKDKCLQAHDVGKPLRAR